MSKGIVVALMAAVALCTAPRAAQAQGHVVIVNAQNAASEVSKATVAKMFLKQARTWADGKPVSAVDLDRAAAARASFSNAVLGRSVANVEEYWLQQVFAGKDEPPAQLKDDSAVMAHVAANPGAIGYVSAGATLSSGVKKVTVSP